MVTATAQSYSPAASSRAVSSLVIGILGIVICPLLSPVAWYLGHVEIADIRDFRAPAAGEGLARVGWVLGLIGTLPLLLIAAVLLLAIPVLVFAAILA